jgi:phenylacetate-CoA ligase
MVQYLNELLSSAQKHLLLLKRNPIPNNMAPSIENLATFPITDRSVLASEPWILVPDNVDYQEMVLYHTAGTTGHSIKVPQHPIAIGKYCSFIEETLKMYHIQTHFSPNHVGIVLVGFQEDTYTFTTRFHALNNTGFIKMDLKSKHWRHPFDACYYLSALQPFIITGDPLAFTQLARLYEDAQKQDPTLIRLHPNAMIPTAVALTPSLRVYLSEFFNCPVIDWYSLTETGPIGYWCRENRGYHLLPTDIFIEILDEEGKAVVEGKSGEITITGGHNPYFPLIRYRTADSGRLITDPCTCGDTMPRIIDLHGRKPVLFQTADNRWINNADLVYILYKYPILEFQFVQHSDQSCDLRFVSIPNRNPQEYLSQVTNELQALLGKEIVLSVAVDPLLLNRPRNQKLSAFISEIQNNL